MVAVGQSQSPHPALAPKSGLKLAVTPCPGVDSPANSTGHRLKAPPPPVNAPAYLVERAGVGAEELGRGGAAAGLQKRADLARIIDPCMSDKKREGGRLSWVLLEDCLVAGGHITAHAMGLWERPTSNGMQGCEEVRRPAVHMCARMRRLHAAL